MKDVEFNKDMFMGELEENEFLGKIWDVLLRVDNMDMPEIEGEHLIMKVVIDKMIERRLIKKEEADDIILGE